MATDPLTVIAEGERLHGLMIANAGSDFEVDCDEDFRLWCKQRIPALLAVARAAADAAKWMRDPRIGNWTYMEDSAFYADLESHRDYITAALQSLTETDHG